MEMENGRTLADMADIELEEVVDGTVASQRSRVAKKRAKAILANIHCAITYDRRPPWYATLVFQVNLYH